MIKNDKFLHSIADIARVAHFKEEIYEFFLDLLFIESIFKLKLDNSLSEKDYLVYKQLSKSSDLIGDLLERIIPRLIESDDKNIKKYFLDVRNKLVHSRDLSNPNANKILYLIQEIELNKLSAIERFELVEDLLDHLAEFTRMRGAVFSTRTPKKLRNFLTSILSLDHTDSIADFTCGTGSLILEAYKSLSSDFTQEVKSKFYGSDINRNMVNIALMHSYIAGARSINIQQQDTLKEYSQNNTKFNKIYGDFPFRMRVQQKDISREFSFQSRNADLLFLESIISSLDNSGMAAVLVPGGMLFSSSPAHTNIRKVLIEEMSVKAVILLPLQLHSISIPLFLLVFQNKFSDDPVLYLDLKHNVLSSRDNKTIDENLLLGKELFQQYLQGETLKIDQETSQLCWLVEKSEIIGSNYILDMNLYRPSSLENEKNVPLSELLTNVEQQLSNTLKTIERIKKLSAQLDSDFKIYETTLEDISPNMKQGKALPRDEEPEDGNIPWVQIRDITKVNGFEIDSAEKSITEEFAQAHRLTLVESETVLFSNRGTLGSVAIAKKRLCVGPNVVAMPFDEEKVNPWFMLGYLLKKKKTFENSAVGAGIPSISLAVLRNMKIEIPQLEDQKIFVEYTEAMKHLQNLKQLSQDQNKDVEQMTDSMFNEFFTEKG